MTRQEFLQKIAQAGWCAYDLNPSWIQVSRNPSHTYPDDGPLDLMAKIDIVLTPEGQINLLLPTRFWSMCPGLPGQLRTFRVIATDWEDAWALIKQLYTKFAPLKRPFEDIVELFVPAERLIPDDLTFFMNHRGQVPSVWKVVEPTAEE